MDNTGLPALTTSTRGSDFYLRPFSRSGAFLANSIALAMLLAFSAFIVVKAWNQLSVYSIAWMAFALFWTVYLFRAVLHSHGSLRMLPAVATVNLADKESPLAAVLRVIAEVSNKVMIFNFLAIFGMLMALALILLRH